MSSTTSVSHINRAGASLVKFRLWQGLIVLRLELKKGFLGKRAFVVYLLGVLPVFLMVMLVSGPNSNRNLQDPHKASILFADVYVILILRTIVFFGCAWIFMNLFKAEVKDKGLHYYFLAPLRRDVLFIAKYFSGLITSVTVFSAVTILSLIFLHIPAGYSASVRFILEGEGGDQALIYILTTCLACMSYGATFQAISLLTRNAALPVFLIYVWESINFLLPPLLKKASIIYYLQTFFPIPISEGPFAIVAEVQPIWISSLSLLGITLLMLIAGIISIKRREIECN